VTWDRGSKSSSPPIDHRRPAVQGIHRKCNQIAARVCDSKLVPNCVKSVSDDPIERVPLPSKPPGCVIEARRGIPEFVHLGKGPAGRVIDGRSRVSARVLDGRVLAGKVVGARYVATDRVNGGNRPVA